MICAQPMAAGSAKRVSHHWMTQISSMVRIRPHLSSGGLAPTAQKGRAYEVTGSRDSIP